MSGLRIREAVVLAGGFGTRLRSVVSELPKPMAPVRGVPFLSHVLHDLRSAGVERVVLAVGYKREIIREHYGSAWGGLEVAYSVEDDPLGTGGGIFQAMAEVKGESAFVVNGDTLFRADLAELEHVYLDRESLLTVALKEMRDFDRYGTVEFDAGKAQIVGFREKRAMAHGFINGGVYLLGKALFELKALPARFSFEQEILEAEVGRGRFHAVAFDRYFIDIGIPEDYARAQVELEDLPEESGNAASRNRGLVEDKPEDGAAPGWMSGLNDSWTLFLDRDGVINRRLVGDYVKRPEEFEFLPGALEGLTNLAGLFGRIVIVTNQRGIGRELMTGADLAGVHAHMLEAVRAAGGRIDAIYHCPDTEAREGGCRKPLPGMAHAAHREFPEIDFKRSVMVGDAPSDIVFGQRLGMQVVWAGEIQGTPPEGATVVESLAEFAERIRALRGA